MTKYPGQQRIKYEGCYISTQAQSNPREQQTDTDNSETQQEIRLEDTIRRVPYALRWAIESMKIPADNGRAIAERIIRDEGQCACDGSVKEKLGTSAAIFMNVPKERQYEIKNRTPGADIDQNSYRSELCGILANLIAVGCIVKTHDITEGTVTIACDNESALWASFGDREPHTGDASHDIIRVI